ncbi:MAG TPA: hypothetical protein VEU62_22765 [Bryobacterales bacterium]|nr:hypothetical protein [Bryobacterales bacterium]
MRLLPIAVLTITLAALAQSPAPEFLEPTVFEQLPAVRLSNDKIQLTIVTLGGFFANLVLRDDPEQLSPYWNPVRMAREAGRRRSSGGMGHFLCVDGFGPVSPEEQAAGLPGHGEAHTQFWQLRASQKSGPTATLVFAVNLSLVEENLTRTVRMVDGESVVYVETELESRLAFDRPICWAEHATIGSPFLEPGKTVVDMPASRAKTRSHESERGPLPHRLVSSQDFTWPLAPTLDGGTVDLRAAPLNPNSLDHTTCLMDPARDLVFFTALHPEKRLLLGYVFHHQEYPWVQNWEDYAPNLKMARGLEFGTQPFDVPRREVIDLRSLFDAPVYRWLPAKSKIGSRFLFFYTHAPEGFRKVDDVRLEGGKLIIEDRSAAKQITLAASLGL